MMLRRHFLAGLAFTVLPSTSDAFAKESDAWPNGATPEDFEAALQAMRAWIDAYQAGDYLAQRRLTDPRMLKWFDRDRWRDKMKRARRRNGALLSYEFAAYSAASSADLPCTEMGHCFREGVDYVIALVETRYEIAKPAQPEFIVVARSEGVWRFGGGTILNRPLGETAVILSVQDERRYKPGYTIVR
jgi:hypothetical protein